MGALLFTSSRRFQLWRYTVSHGQLLLRSTKSSSEKTRIDILFKDVISLNLKSLLDGLRIETDVHGTSNGSSRVFRIESSEFNGFVEASDFFHETDEAEYSEPSPFEKSLGRAL